MTDVPGASYPATAGRLCDVACALAGLLILLPALATIAVLVLVCDGPPVLFCQTRVGKGGRPFRMWKFRTMRQGSAGIKVTAAGDSRVTGIGAWLRRLKLDELPQLFNVLRGDMSLIGPRPEVPEYVNLSSPIWQAVLQVRPGITDPATLLYRNEEALLALSSDVEDSYRHRVLPRKLTANLTYLNCRCFRKDVKLLWWTLCCCLSPRRFRVRPIQEAFLMEVQSGR
jgi:lipopolysaccharide/colanic/teichoic acid biosynthesis glycosyltransferase